MLLRRCGRCLETLLTLGISPPFLSRLLAMKPCRYEKGFVRIRKHKMKLDQMPSDFCIKAKLELSLQWWRLASLSCKSLITFQDNETGLSILRQPGIAYSATPNCIRILWARDFGCQTYTFHRGNSGTVNCCPNMAQINQLHPGRCTFGSRYSCLKYANTLKVVIHFGVVL
jgi:hypothetical protein